MLASLRFGRPSAGLFVLASVLGAALGAGSFAGKSEGASAVASAGDAAGTNDLSMQSRSLGDVSPIKQFRPTRRAPGGANADTVTVYHADLEGLSSPGNEGGFTHIDLSGLPTAWNIAPTVTCTGNAFWCGIIDSSWTGDPNRRGYANGWVQVLSNFADLNGALSPYKITFRQRLDIEQGFDFARVEVFDPTDTWITLAGFTGTIPSGGGPCNLATITIPDSVVAHSPTVLFRFVLETDVQGSSADGLYPGEGWAIDDVTVSGGLSDVRFFDDFEAGMGTWSVSTFPPVGDFWRISAAPPTQQLCTTNASKVWNPVNAASGALVPRMNDHLISPPVFVNGAGQIFLSFDVYRDLSLSACFYYEVMFRFRDPGGGTWSGWASPTGLLYFGNEREWLRQTIPLAGGAGAESVQVRIAIRDYADLFCDGVSTSTGTALFLDNIDVRIIADANPTLVTSEGNLFQDTFRTTAFFGNDNLNTARGDSVAVRIGASRGLKNAFLKYSLNGGPFLNAALTAVGAAAPDIYFGDVPAGAYPRGTQLRYYFSATDSTDVVATLPADATTASHYFTASILPAIHTPTSLCADDSARVLYVNAYAGPEAVTGVDLSLVALGLRYDRYDVNAAASAFGNTPGGGDPGSPGPVWPGATASNLRSYRAIIWDVGERTAATLSAQDQTLAQSWLALAGRNRGLVLAGDNLAYDLVVNGHGIAGFLGCAVGASYLRDAWENAPLDSLLPAPKGAPNTRIAGDSFGLNGDCPGINLFDGLSTAACGGGSARAWLLWPNGLVAGTERLAALASPGDSSKAMLLGFTFAAMPSAARRNLLLWRTVVEEMEVPFCSTPTAVETPDASSPVQVARLLPPAPNPFNPRTTVRFSLARPSRVRLSVYSVSGARVRVLADRSFGPGEHQVPWDGRDDRGREVGSAAYLVRLEVEGRSEARKVVLLR